MLAFFLAERTLTVASSLRPARQTTQRPKTPLKKTFSVRAFTNGPLVGESLGFQVKLRMASPRCSDAVGIDNGYATLAMALRRHRFWRFAFSHLLKVQLASPGSYFCFLAPLLVHFFVFFLSIFPFFSDSIHRLSLFIYRGFA